MDKTQCIINPFGGSHTREFIVGADKHIVIIQEPGIARMDATIRITGQNSVCRLVMLVKGTGNQEITITTRQHHTKGGSVSSVLVKSVLDDSASLKYTGVIRVEKGANRTDAYQRNDNLMLSDCARVVSEPVLEILSNDLRCTHGATTGMIDPSQVWYLKSRAIPPELIRRMISQGFLLDGLKNIDIPAIQPVVKSMKMSGGF